MIKIKKKFEPIAMSFIMSIKMAFLMTLFNILMHEGFVDNLFSYWLISGFLSWCIAFPLAVVMGLITYKFTLNKVFTLVEDIE